jgi:hypothetical protein
LGFQFAVFAVFDQCVANVDIVSIGQHRPVSRSHEIIRVSDLHRVDSLIRHSLLPLSLPSDGANISLCSWRSPELNREAPDCNPHDLLHAPHLFAHLVSCQCALNVLGRAMCLLQADVRWMTGVGLFSYITCGRGRRQTCSCASQA